MNWGITEYALEASRPQHPPNLECRDYLAHGRHEPRQALRRAAVRRSNHCRPGVFGAAFAPIAVGHCDAAILTADAV